MDRIEFTRTMYENFGKNIVMFYDQVMALYELIGSMCDESDICAEKSKQGISFVLLTEDKQQTDILYNILNEQKINIYGHKYIAKLKKNKNGSSINIIVEEESKEENDGYKIL